MRKKRIFDDGQITIPFMKLTLDRPIVFFDVETTGLNIGTDRIIEIAMLKVMPDGQTRQLIHRINPGRPIPDEAYQIHGISNEDVADKPTFSQLAGEIATFIRDCDLGGYNVDVQAIFFKKEPRNLSAAYRFYCGRNLENAHSAMADVQATWEVLQAQLDRYDDLVPKVESLSEMSQASKFVDFAGRIIFDDAGEELFNFGRHKGKKVLDVFRKEPQYYDWMMQGDFPEYTKRVISRIYLQLRNT
jgi:DNA polymerase-3 subunit epsilon